MCKKRTTVLGLIVFLIVVLGLGARGVALSNDPSFCGNCHIIEPFYRSWQDASHARRGVQCVDCHFRPGLAGRIQGETYAALKLAQFAIGAYDQPTGAMLVTNQNCLRCHSDMLSRQIPLPGGLSFAHETHVKKAHAECRLCHLAIGHPGAVTQPIVTQPPRIARDVCLRCHDGKAAPVVFGAAVPSGVVHPAPPLLDTGEWRQTHWRAVGRPMMVHGQPFQIVPEACAKCHGNPEEAAECRPCHKPPASDYKAEVKPCLKCHQETMTKTLTFEGVPYMHVHHLLQTNLVCSDCHRQITHQLICEKCHDGEQAPDIFGGMVALPSAGKEPGTQ